MTQLSSVPARFPVPLQTPPAPTRATYRPWREREQRLPTFRAIPVAAPGQAELSPLALLKLASNAAQLPFIACEHRDQRGETGILVSETTRLDTTEVTCGGVRQVRSLDGETLLSGTELHLSRLLTRLRVDPWPHTDADLAYLSAGMSRMGMTVYFQGSAFPLRIRAYPDQPDHEDHLIDTAEGEHRFATRRGQVWTADLHLLERAFRQRTLPPAP